MYRATSITLQELAVGDTLGLAKSTKQLSLTEGMGTCSLHFLYRVSAVPNSCSDAPRSLRSMHDDDTVDYPVHEMTRSTTSNVAATLALAKISFSMTGAIFWKKICH